MQSDTEFGFHLTQQVEGLQRRHIVQVRGFQPVPQGGKSRVVKLKEGKLDGITPVFHHSSGRIALLKCGESTLC